MPVHDLDARFDAITTADGSIAAQAVQAIREAATTINDLVQGEPYQLVTVVQALETAAHQAGRFLNFQEGDQPGEVDPEPPADPYEGKTVAELSQELHDRREAGREVLVSGTRDEMIMRLRQDDKLAAKPG